MLNHASSILLVYFSFIFPICHHVDFIPLYYSFKQDLLTLSWTRIKLKIFFLGTKSSLSGILHPYNSKFHVKLAVVLHVSVNIPVLLTLSLHYHITQKSQLCLSVFYWVSDVCNKRRHFSQFRKQWNSSILPLYFNPSLPLTLYCWKFYIPPLSAVV